MSSQPNTHESALVASTRDGDQSAFSNLVQIYYSAALRIAYHVLKSYDTAADVVQDAFVQLWERRETLDPSKPILGILTTIVRRRAIDEWRKQETRHNKESAAVVEVEEDQESRGEEFESIIASLPERISLALRLRYLSGLTFPEVGQAMEISDKAAQQLVIRGLRELKQRMRED